MLWLIFGLILGIAAALPAGVWLAEGIWSYAIVLPLVKQRAATAWRQWSGRE